MIRNVFALGVLLAIGCGAPDVTLEADSTSYAQGDTVQLVLSNNTLASVFYSQTLRLERNQAGAWADADPDMPNLYSYPILGPNRTLSREVQLSSDIPTGMYRVSELTSWVNAKDAYLVYSAPFAVGPQDCSGTTP